MAVPQVAWAVTSKSAISGTNRKVKGFDMLKSIVAIKGLIK
jgi:hypothetical protein